MAGKKDTLQRIGVGILLAAAYDSFSGGAISKVYRRVIPGAPPLHRLFEGVMAHLEHDLSQLREEKKRKWVNVEVIDPPRGRNE